MVSQNLFRIFADAHVHALKLPQLFFCEACKKGLCKCALTFADSFKNLTGRTGRQQTDAAAVIGSLFPTEQTACDEIVHGFRYMAFGNLAELNNIACGIQPRIVCKKGENVNFRTGKTVFFGDCVPERVLRFLENENIVQDSFGIKHDSLSD